MFHAVPAIVKAHINQSNRARGQKPSGSIFLARWFERAYCALGGTVGRTPARPYDVAGIIRVAYRRRSLANAFAMVLSGEPSAMKSTFVDYRDRYYAIGAT